MVIRVEFVVFFNTFSVSNVCISIQTCWAVALVLEKSVWGACPPGGPVPLVTLSFSSSVLKELPCSALAPSLEPCFSRPERPANRRPPSRWAPHPATASPAPSPGEPTSLEELGDEEPPGEKPHV